MMWLTSEKRTHTILQAISGLTKICTVVINCYGLFYQKAEKKIKKNLDGDGFVFLRVYIANCTQLIL